jgi:hypothetical protein
MEDMLTALLNPIYPPPDLVGIQDATEKKTRAKDAHLVRPPPKKKPQQGFDSPECVPCMFTACSLHVP